jgi:hypothetical protein
METMTTPRRMYLTKSFMGKMEIPQKRRISGQSLQKEYQLKLMTPRLFRMNNIPIAIRIKPQKRCLYFIVCMFYYE